MGHLATFIQENFMGKQVADIKRIGDFLTKMKRVGTGLGVHMVDIDIAAFIDTRKGHTEVRIGNCTVEEDVNKIVNYEGNYFANMFTEKLWLKILIVSDRSSSESSLYRQRHLCAIK